MTNNTTKSAPVTAAAAAGAAAFLRDEERIPPSYMPVEDDVEWLAGWDSAAAAFSTKQVDGNQSASPLTPMEQIAFVALTAGAPGGRDAHAAIERIILICIDAGISTDVETLKARTASLDNRQVEE